MRNEFAAIFDTWLQADPERTHEKIGALVGVSTAAISQWRNGRSAPEAKYIPRLAELMQMDHFHLAHLAYGWELPENVPVPPRDSLLLEIDMLLKRLLERSPDLLPGVAEVVRGLERFARKREREAVAPPDGR